MESIDILNFYQKKELNSIEIANAYYEYVKKNFVPYNVNNKKVREIEMVVKNAPFETMSILYNYKNKDVSSYIEIKNTSSGNVKTRIRKDLNKFSYYIGSKQMFVDMFKTETKEIKHTINQEEFGKEIIFKSADEHLGALQQDIQKIQFFFVNSVKIQNAYFRVETRQRTLLFSKDNKSNDLILSYFNKNNDKRSFDLEIELNTKLTSINEKDFKENFLKIFSMSFGSSVQSFYMNFEEPPTKQIKTHMTDLASVIKLNYENYLVTKKIDGQSMYFYVKNSICYITYSSVFKELECNIPKDFEIIGMGEYVIQNGVREIYPFHIESIKKRDVQVNFSSRLEILQYYKNKINKKTQFSSNDEVKGKLNVNEKIGITFMDKEFYGPFDNRTDFLKTIGTVYDQISVYETDGIILVDNAKKPVEEIVDLKFKHHNTIDLYTNIVPTESSNGNNTLSANFCLYTSKRNNATGRDSKYFTSLFNLKQSSSEEFYYDSELSMNICVNNNLKKVYPVNLITEYNIEKNTFKPRLDKTNKMFGKKKYYGNNYNVIMHSIVLHKYGLNNASKILSLTDNLSTEELDKYADNLKTEIETNMKNEMKEISNTKETVTISVDSELGKEIKNINTPLNVDKNWYNKENGSSNRTNLNIISNLNKTMGLNIAASPFLNLGRYKSVFSIYCGKGGDMGKFVTQGITTVVGIDPDTIALSEFERRRNNYSENRNKIFNLITIPLALEDEEFLQKVYSKAGKNTYDIIDCQLGIHFSFNKNTEEHIGFILKELSNKSELSKTRPKTRLIISTNDKTNIFNLFQKYKSDVLDFKIDDSNNYIISKKGDDKISVFYKSSMKEPMEEYLIEKNYFVKFLEKIGFVLKETWTFDEIMERSEIYDELSKKYDRDSSKKFLSILKNVNMKEYDLTELCSIFRYYIFEYRF